VRKIQHYQEGVNNVCAELCVGKQENCTYHLGREGMYMKDTWIAAVLEIQIAQKLQSGHFIEFGIQGAHS
jgi:hypothetical protein